MLERMRASRIGTVCLSKRTLLASQLIYLARKLLPYLQHRDLLSIAHTNLCTSLSTTFAALTAAEAENVVVTRDNVTRAEALFKLVEEAGNRAEDVQDHKLRTRIEALQRENTVGRSRWRTMKSLMGAVIVGSGIDWARDEQLRELVANDEEASD